MEQHGISKLDLKRQNRMQVLKILKQRGPTSRIDIAATLELTRAAVTIITNEMIEQGIIHEIGELKHETDKAPRGRKKILIDINHNYKFALGVSVDEDYISVGLSTLAGDVLDKRNTELTCEMSTDEIFEFIKSSVSEMMNDNCLGRADILGIGMGVFPNVYERLGISVENGQPDYSSVRKRIAEYTSLPLVIDNSVKGSAMANIDFLKDRTPDRINTAFLHYGNSIHYAVINLNDPLRSYDNRTDFVDSIIVNPNAKEVVCECKRKGCVRSEITPMAIIKKLENIYSAEMTPVLYKVTGGDKKNLNVSSLYDAYRQGDKAVARIYDEVMTLLAVLLNNLYFASNPQKIMIHNMSNLKIGYDKLIRRVREIGGDVVARAVEISIIEDKHRFLSGCALAIRELFYTRGGYDGSHQAAQ